jgi:hypothetical protein
MADANVKDLQKRIEALEKRDATAERRRNAITDEPAMLND